MVGEWRKKVSLIATIAVVLLIAVGGYYLINLKQGPYPASTFISLSYKWGVGDTLLNSYNSATGDYQYLDNEDKLVSSHVKLRANDIIYLHNKANELGLWDLPNLVANPNTDLKSKQILRYEMVFNYEQKTKKIVFMTNYDQNPAFADAAKQLQEVILKTLNEAEDRYTTH